MDIITEMDIITNINMNVIHIDNLYSYLVQSLNMSENYCYPESATLVNYSAGVKSSTE